MACQCSKRFYYFCFFLSTFITSQKVHQGCSWSNHLGQFIKWHSRHLVLLLRVPINPSSGHDASSQATPVLGFKNCFSLISSSVSPPPCHCNYKPSPQQPAFQRLLLCKRIVAQTTEFIRCVQGIIPHSQLVSASATAQMELAHCNSLIKFVTLWSITKRHKHFFCITIYNLFDSFLCFPDCDSAEVLGHWLGHDCMSQTCEPTTPRCEASPVLKEELNKSSQCR